MLDRAVFIHDTYRVISCNEAACQLFRCERYALDDRLMTDLIASEDMRGLAALRLKIIRGGNTDLPNLKYPFLRCDGTQFWGYVGTIKCADGTFETIITYEDEA